MAELRYHHEPLYRVGDVLRIRQLDDIPNPCVFGWTPWMNKLSGKVFTVLSVVPANGINYRGYPRYYSEEGVEQDYFISEDMLEPIQDERNIEPASNEDFELLFRGVIS